MAPRRGGGLVVRVSRRDRTLDAAIVHVGFFFALSEVLLERKIMKASNFVLQAFCIGTTLTALGGCAEQVTRPADPANYRL